MFDWMFGGRKEIDPWSGAVINDPGAGGDFMNLNIARMLGETGAALGGEGSWQEAVGLGASNLARAKAIQEAGAKQLERKDEFDQKMIQALAGRFTSPEDDPALPDKITFDKGKYKIEGSPVTTPEIGFDDEEPKIESRNIIGGTNLPDFP